MGKIQSHVECAIAYVRQVVQGQIPACVWVKAACQRQLDDLERWQGQNASYQWDAQAAENICASLELLPHVKGEWAKRCNPRIKLEPWQQFILSTVFGWRKPDGPRRFNRVYIEVPRKNSKSTLSAGVGLWMLGPDGEAGPEVYSAATTRDQARVVFQIAQEMARRTPEFRAEYGIEVGQHAIYSTGNAAKYEPLSSDDKGLEGKNVHCGIIDELHAHETRKVWDVIETGIGARVQPLIWAITTAGSNRSGICYEQREYVCRLLRTVLRLHPELSDEVRGPAGEDDSYFGIIYTIDEGDDWTDKDVWAKANPNLGISVYRDYIEGAARKAMQLPSAVNTFLTRHLDVWVTADTAWMPMRAWDKCADPLLRLENFAGQPCWIYLDLASKVDLAAMSILFRRAGMPYAFGRYYVPEEVADASENSQYSGWVRSGRLIATPGNVIDFDYIKTDLRDLKSRFQIREVAYDPFQATQFSTDMRAEGFPMIEVGMTVKNFSEPMKALEAAVIAAKFRHDGCPILGWMISNVVAHRDQKDNIFPRKEKTDNKIDGAVALIGNLGRMLLHQPLPGAYQNAAEILI